MTTAAAKICSRALLLIGDKPIADLAENETRAVACNTEYEPCVLEMIQAHDWNFASKRVANLPVLNPPPVWGFTRAYQLPPDCLRVRATTLDPSEGGGDEWQVEGHTLVTNATPLSIRFTWRAGEELWTPAFTLAVVYEMARRLSYAITGKASHASDGGLVDEKKCARRLALAKALDGGEGTPKRYISDALIRVRQ